MSALDLASMHFALPEGAVVSDCTFAGIFVARENPNTSLAGFVFCDLEIV